MTKPEHFREIDIKVCEECKYCKLTYHHCSACSGDDEYTCIKHDFILSNFDMGECVCDDYEEKKWN